MDIWMYSQIRDSLFMKYIQAARTAVFRAATSKFNFRISFLLPRRLRKKRPNGWFRYQQLCEYILSVRGQGYAGRRKCLLRHGGGIAESLAVCVGGQPHFPVYRGWISRYWLRCLLPLEPQRMVSCDVYRRASASNHAFVDGNKRIGAMMTQLLLKWNGFQMSLCSGELADMFIAIADRSAEESDLLAWIQRHLE